MSVGEVSVGEESVGEMSVGEFHVRESQKQSQKRIYFGGNIIFTNKINEISVDMQFKLIAISKMKNNKNCPYLTIALIWSGDNNLNDQQFEILNSKGLHFIHLNVNSLLTKIDELSFIDKCSNAALIGITETKLDNTIDDSEVAVDGYSILRNYRNRKGEGAACYIRNICFSSTKCLSNNIENIFTDLLFSRTKPISGLPKAFAKNFC